MLALRTAAAARMLFVKPTATARAFTTTPPKRALTPPEDLDERELHVFQKLDKELEPSRLTVQDVSGGCGSMYAIEISSAKFKGLPMMRQHRLVNQILADEIKTWHGVQLQTKAE